MIDTDPLRYAGLMGHTVAVVEGPRVNRKVVAESDDVAWARAQIERSSWKNPAIYQRQGKRWVRVR
jgi:hypothetical protein